MFPCITCKTPIEERDSLCAECLKATINDEVFVEEPKQDAWEDGPHGDGCNANCWCWI